MKTVIDTSTLISLAKINFLYLLRDIRRNIFIPETIYQEAVIKGEEKALTDAVVIKNFIENNKIKVLAVKDNYLKLLRTKMKKALVYGDEAVIALAFQTKANEIITNDDGLGKIAMFMGFRVNATPDLLLEGLKTNAVNLKDYENFLRNLIIENRITSVIAELYIMEGKKYVKD